MPGDDLYKNLKEPTADSFPKFEEESWKKMELLLDKHLPESNGKGRVFPYILFISCIIVASLTTFLPAKKLDQADGNISSTGSLTGNANPSIEKTAVEPTPVADERQSITSPPEVQEPKALPSHNNDHANNTVLVRAKLTSTKQSTTVRIQPVKENSTTMELIINDKPVDVADVSLVPTGAVFIGNKNDFRVHANAQVKNALLVTSNEKASPSRKHAKNGLSFTFSAGLETPGTAFNNWGRLTPVVGVGLMYNIGEKIIIRTGVATATKIYSAHDKDYNPPNSYWANYTYFKKIEADCKVIEIPLGIAYRVVGSKKTNVYVSAGSSSIIMHKEAYNYYYKNQAGRDTVTHRAWNYNSLHLFSSVNFSAIAERKISNRFSLMAEPSIKIPSGGIGVGKIRLYNAGLTITTRFKLR